MDITSGYTMLRDSSVRKAFEGSLKDVNLFMDDIRLQRANMIKSHQTSFEQHKSTVPLVDSFVSRSLSKSDLLRMKEEILSGEREVDKEDQEKIAQFANDLIEKIDIPDTRLKFEVNEDIRRTVITVIDQSTDETIRQIPSEDLIDVAIAIHEFLDTSDSKQTSDESEFVDKLKGMLFNKKA